MVTVLQVVDEAGERGGAETIIDVDHRYPSRAAVEHAKQRSHATEVRTVADRRRDSDHRHPDKASHNTWQGSFHSSHNDDHARTLQQWLLMKQAMKPGNSDVVETLYLVAHHLERSDRLFSDIGICRSGGNHKHEPLTGDHVVLFEGDDSSVGVIDGRRRHSGDLGKGFRRSPSDKQAGLSPNDLPRDGSDLFGRLPYTEDDLREPCADASVVIYAGDGDVFERARAQRIEQLALSGLRHDAARRNIGQQRFQPQRIHTMMIMLLNDAR
jgi:hypothetical protein